MADPLSRTFQARYTLENDGKHAPLGATVTVVYKAHSDTDQDSEVPLGALYDTGRARRCGSSTILIRPCPYALSPSSIWAKKQPALPGTSNPVSISWLLALTSSNLRRNSRRRREPTGECTVTGFNLSAWAVRERTLTLFFILAVLIAGAFASCISVAPKILNLP